MGRAFLFVTNAQVVIPGFARCSGLIVNILQTRVKRVKTRVQQLVAQVVARYEIHDHTRDGAAQGLRVLFRKNPYIGSVNLLPICQTSIQRS